LEEKKHIKKIEAKLNKVPTIVDSKVHGRTVILDVKYTASISSYVVDNQDKLVSGDKKSKDMEMIWTWARNVDADDLNWELTDISLVS